MSLLGVGIHPVFQKGLSIERVAAEGFAWCAVKVSQGTTAYPGGPGLLARARAAGMIPLPYHYLDAGHPAAQAATLHAAAGGRPAMVDVEKGSGDVAHDLRPFLAECAHLGQRICLDYLPRWYWESIGRPDLRGTPPLVASHYTAAKGTAAAEAATVPDSWWAGYGGNSVAILQHTDHALVAGMLIDADVYRGTHDQLVALLGATDPPPAPTARPVTVEDAVARPINVEYTTDAQGRRVFYGGERCENGSPAVRWGAVSVGSHWGAITGGKVSFLAGDGADLGHYDFGAIPGNHSVGYPVPSGCRSVTVEGTLDAGAQGRPAVFNAAIWELAGTGA